MDHLLLLDPERLLAISGRVIIFNEKRHFVWLFLLFSKYGINFIFRVCLILRFVVQETLTKDRRIKKAWKIRKEEMKPRHLFNYNSSVIRQKSKYQNGCYKKTKYAKFCKKRIIFTEYLACFHFLVTRSEIRPFALLPTNLCFVLRTVLNNESTHIRPVTPHHPPENIWRK